MIARTLACALAGGAPIQAQPAPRPHPPALVVFLTVDQLRPDYFPRWNDQLTGGLGRLYRQGVFFARGHQEHAITETAPGHATLLSGREPAHTGIVTNERGVGDPSSPVLGSLRAPGASPRRFQGTTLFDWMRAADPGARVLSVSRKDRGAIVPVGRARAPVFWYVDGRFTTSRWYADALPAWVRAYNARGGAAHLAGTRWSLLLAPSAYPEPDSLPFENAGREVAFPHPLPGSPGAAARELTRYPWMDSLTLDFALEGARRLGLGRRGRPDLLAVSLSTTDAVGHAFGPDSRELHDQVLRLDRWLGVFLDSLARLIPRERTIVALSADHGVQSLPEFARLHGDTAARRVWLGDLGTRYDLEFDSGLLSGDTRRLRARGVNTDSLAEALAAIARRRPGVIAAYTPASLARAPARDREATLWRRQLPSADGWLVCASLRPGSVWSRPDRRVAQHGSTAPADITVPIAFLVPGLPPARVQRVARTVDIAPTLAALLGVRPTERLDGNVMWEVVRRPR